MRRLRRQRVEPPQPNNETAGPTEGNADLDIPSRRLSLRQPLPFGINWPPALVISALIALTVLALLRNQGLLPVEVLFWWPAVIVIPAVIWFFTSLAHQSPRDLVGSTALLGLSISLLLASQNVAPLG